MSFIKPMLASSSGDTLPALVSDRHAYEPKYDGIRAIVDVAITGAIPSCHIYARSGADKTASFPDVAEAAMAVALKTKTSFILDGEIVSIGKDGKPGSFQGMQTRMHVTTHVERSVKEQPCALIAFDLLEHDGTSLLNLTWVERRQALVTLLTKAKVSTSSGIIRAGLFVLQDGTALLKTAISEGWEGLIVKRMASRYGPGKRNPDWVKLKFKYEQEFVVCGFTSPRESRTLLGALVLGIYEGGTLTYVGRAGTGFTEKELVRVHALLSTMTTPTSPFTGKAPKMPTGVTVTWVKPTLLAQIKYCEATENETAQGESLRFPVYLGMRDDKDAKDVTWEHRPKFNR